MKKHLLLPFCVFLLFSVSVQAQLKQETVVPALKQHISTLASDAYQGRETGENGETMASEYIRKAFEQIGLTPKGTEGYSQAFPFTKETLYSTDCKLVVNGTAYQVGTDFFPLAYTANGSASGEAMKAGYGISALKLNYDDYKKVKHAEHKIFVLEYGVPDHAGPHSKYADYSDIRTRLDSAIAKGAAAVIFVNSDKELSNPKAEYKNRITPCSIPVLFADGKAAAAVLKKKATIQMTSGLIRKDGTGHNMIGYIDNGAATTVVIGAHYDHLGYGADGSLYRGEPAIHNGADDNASGTAALIELARTLKQDGPHSNNYLIMAYSGEEKGLLGSGYWVKNPTLPLEQINYMINMDMVGRLKPEDPVVIISGVGTSDAWKPMMDFVHVDSLKTKTTESGVGPSDHTSFYLHEIPVLHFFSGTHSDYHKPSDDEALINYSGEVRIMDYILQLIQKLDDKGKLKYIKTKEDSNEDAPRFKVTLGVVPDYAFDGQGMRIDGVSDGKPASKAGLKAGDIVTALGEHKVLDMMSYMKALGKFSKGDKVIVTYLRNSQSSTVEVEF